MATEWDTPNTLHAPPPSKLWGKAGHDLKQPVQALLYLSRALRQPDVGNSRLLLLDKLENALQELQDHISILTEVLRLADVAIDKVPLADVHDTVMRELEALAEADGFAVRSRKPSGIGLSDARMLRLMLTGLVLNAAQLSNGRDILAGWRTRGSCAVFEVYFKAPTVGPAQTCSAFVEWRGRNRTPAASGLGLGTIAHLGGVLHHRLELTPLPRGGQRLSLTVPLT